MGLLMYREPESPEPQKIPKSDPTAQARSSIRRIPAGRRSYILRRYAETERNRATESTNLLRTNSSDVQNTAAENTGSQGNEEESVEAEAWGVVPGSTEHQQLREVYNSTEPLSRTSQQRWRSGGPDYLERVRRARRDVDRQQRQQRQRLVDILNSTTTNNGELPVYLLSQSTNEPPQPIPSVPDVTMSNTSGLGDRRRSPSPEEATWETLRESIQADERLPSASSSFASTAAVSSASLSRERSMRSSPATSIMSGAEPALSFYPPQRNDRRIRAANAQDAADDENFTSLFVCDSNPSSDDEQETGVSGPQNPLTSTYEGTITFTTDGRMIRTPPTPARSPPHNTETPTSRTPQTTHAERRRRLHSMLAAANDPSRRSYTGPAIPRGPTPPAGRSRERSPGHTSRALRRWRSTPLTPPPPPRRAESLLAHVEAANGERSHAGRAGDDRQSESRRSGSAARDQLAHNRDDGDDNEHMRGSQAVHERLQNVNELHQRYAALQRQEGHLNDLIQRLTSEEDVPDALWGLAGVERQRVEHGAAATAAAEEARAFREMRERESRASVYERLSRALDGPDVVVEVNGRPFDGLLGVQFAAEDAELERGLRQWAERRSRGEGRPFEVEEPLAMQVSDL